MKRVFKALFMVAIAIAVGVGTVYAWTHDGYVTVESGISIDNETTYENSLVFSTGADYIRMSSGTDYIYMSSGNDEIGMGGGDDTLTFFAQSGNTETIAFDENKTSYIKYTQSDDTIEIKSDSGDVIITLGD